MQLARAVVAALLALGVTAGCSRTTIPGALVDSPSAGTVAAGTGTAGTGAGSRDPAALPSGGSGGGQSGAGAAGISPPPPPPRPDCEPGQESEPGMIDDPCVGIACSAGVARARCLPGGSWSACFCAPLPAAEECVADLAERYPDADPSGSECVCRHCDALLLECLSDDLCRAIFECALQVGCFGAECYRPDACMAEIDRAGISSSSVMQVSSVGECMDGAGCPRQRLR